MESGSRNDARIRGNAQQLLEKYKSLARDATSAGDRILAEYYMQHADHYYRVLAEFRSRYEDSRPRDRDERDERDQDDMNYEDDAADVSVPQSYGGRHTQHSLSLEPAAETAAAVEAPAEPAPVTPAAEATEASAEEEKPRRRRGRPRKVKPEAEGEATAAENAA